MFLVFKLKKKTIITLLVSITIISILILSLFYNDIKLALHYDPTDGYWETPRYRILRFLHEGDPTRKKTWESAISIIKNNFWLGTGIGDLTDLLQTFREKDSYAFINRLNSHNQYLSIIGTTGFIGFFIFLLLMANNIIIAFKNKSLLFFSFLIITSIAFFTDNILSRQWGLIFFCIFNYLIYEHYNTAKREAQ
jgi:O-antigen ligase